MPDQWGQAEYREVSNGKTLQFFFAGDEIKVCTLKDGQTEHYYSSSDWLLFFNGGLAINANRALTCADSVMCFKVYVTGQCL